MVTFMLMSTMLGAQPAFAALNDTLSTLRNKERAASVNVSAKRTVLFTTKSWIALYTAERHGPKALVPGYRRLLDRTLARLDSIEKNQQNAWNKAQEVYRVATLERVERERWCSLNKSVGRPCR